MGLSELLNEKCISLSLKSVLREDAIKELINLLVLQGKVSHGEELYRAVMRREEEFTTGIGLGIAIPHAKTSVVDSAAIAFGRSLQGVSWPSQDGNPVHLLFLIAVPIAADNQHLQLLAKLSRKLVHQEVRDNIISANSAAEIIDILGS
jgi:fructose-specific phosphotransferase system IIA component